MFSSPKLSFDIRPFLQNLPTTCRPEEVKAWIKNKKKDSPPDVDIDAYGSSFMAWWIAIQPTWRLANDSSFVYATPAMEDWRSLHKGGAAGLYTVIVALSWWIKALPLADSSIRAWTAVHDVNWVIDQISEKIEFGRASPGKKRGHEEPTPPGKGKRFVSISSLLIMFLKVISPGDVQSKFSCVMGDREGCWCSRDVIWSRYT